MSFSFEKLNVYQKALDCIDRRENLIEDCSRKMTPSQSVFTCTMHELRADF